MKNILKKLGIVAIIVGILSPFVSLPSVSAATSDCDHYLNQYFFLDVTSGNSWKHYTDDGGYKTYTSFKYTFPSLAEGQTLTIESVGEAKLTTNSDVERLHNAYLNLIDADKKTLEAQEHFGKADNYSYTSGDYKQITHILHGYWAQENEGLIPTNFDQDENDLSASNWYSKNTIQGVLIGNDIGTSKLDVEFSGAKLKNSSDGYTTVYAGNDEIDDYFEILVNTVNGVNTSKNAINEKYIITTSDFPSDSGVDSNEKYLNIGIRREIPESVLEKLVFGRYFEEKDGYGEAGWYALTTDTSKEKPYKSYQALENLNDVNGYCTENTPCGWVKVDKESDIHIKLADKNSSDKVNESNYYWPVLLNVEYKVCNTSSATGKWALTYDDNVDDTSVTNMPNPISEEANVGTSIKVSSTTPKRTDYAFNGWCTESNGSGDCYKAGDEVKNSTATKLTLFAQWAKEGTENNNKMGVISYVIGFAAVGVIAGGIYLISKKKNLFKQI